jgi:hypothetical protein
VAGKKRSAAERQWQDYPEVMRRVEATQKAIEALAKDLDLAKPKRASPAQRSPFLGAPGKRFTTHQRQFLAELAVLAKKLGKPPSAAEMGAHTGLSRLGARRVLMALEEHGLCADVPRVLRSGQWALTEQGAAVVAEDE